MTSNFGSLLSEMGGWHVGCENEHRYAGAVDHALAAGYLSYRQHWIPLDSTVVQAYELTDAGLAKVRELCGKRIATSAEKRRTWYREKAALLHAVDIATFTKRTR